YLTLPETVLHLITPKAYGDSEGRESFKSRTGLTFDPVSAAEAAANNTLKLLLHPQRLNRLARMSATGGTREVYEKLMASTFKLEPQQHAQRQIHHRILHVVVYRWIDAMNNPGLAPEVRAQMAADLSDLEAWLDAHDDSAQHRYLQQQIARYRDDGEWAPAFEPVPLPPGSPI